MIAGAFALLIFCIRAASAQESAVAPAAESQPYGIKPIPGYVPPSAPPAGLRGSYENPAPVREAPAPYGYVPLRPAAPVQPISAPGRPLYDGFAPPSNPDYRLGPGDKLRVTVFGESDLSGEYQLDGMGLVRLPLIGTLRAAGATAPDLEHGITQALGEGYLKNPRVNVEIIGYRPFYIIGAVNRPGQYPYVDNMNALNAVALAGGFTDQAVQSTLYVRHEGVATEQAIRTDQLIRIQPGDVVRVKTTLFWDAMNLFSPVAGPAAIAAATLR